MESINQKYIHYKYILNRVSADTRELGVNIVEEDIGEWCAECEIDYIKKVEYFVPFLRIPLRVTEGVSKLPCNVYRILDVYCNVQRVGYYNDGSFLRLSEDYSNDYVFINYTGIPLGDDFIPLILRGHEQACVAFCILKLVKPLFIAKKYDANLYMLLKDDLDIQCQAAKNGYRHMDRGQVDQRTVVWGNIIPKIGSLALYHEAFADNGVGSINEMFWNV